MHEKKNDLCKYDVFVLRVEYFVPSQLLKFQMVLFTSGLTYSGSRDIVTIVHAPCRISRLPLPKLQTEGDRDS